MRIWKVKPLHERHPNEIIQNYIDSIAYTDWLTAGKMFIETKGLLLAGHSKLGHIHKKLTISLKSLSKRQMRIWIPCAGKNSTAYWKVAKHSLQYNIKKGMTHWERYFVKNCRVTQYLSRKINLLLHVQSWTCSTNQRI